MPGLLGKSSWKYSGVFRDKSAPKTTHMFGTNKRKLEIGWCDLSLTQTKKRDLISSMLKCKLKHVFKGDSRKVCELQVRVGFATRGESRGWPALLETRSDFRKISITISIWVWPNFRWHGQICWLWHSQICWLWHSQICRLDPPLPTTYFLSWTSLLL